MLARGRGKGEGKEKGRRKEGEGRLVWEEGRGGRGWWKIIIDYFQDLGAPKTELLVFKNADIDFLASGAFREFRFCP
jgi:hypothetical protein